MILINCKEGVWFKFIDHHFIELARIVFRVYQKRGVIPVVTSACDGVHMTNSYHYQGLGWDWRIWGIDNSQTPQNEVKEAADEIRTEAQNLDFHYDVIYGDSKHLDHIHTEWDAFKRS